MTTFDSRTYQVFAAVYIIGIFAGPALIGLAPWRSQSVPRWLAVLFFAGLELAQQLGSIGPARVILSPCHLRWQWSCWPPGSGGQPRGRPAAPSSPSP